MAGTAVRDINAASKRFVRNASAGVSDYKANVAQSGPAWQSGAQAGIDNWAAGTQEAISTGRYGRAIRNTDPSYVAQRAASIGADRYVGGVTAGAQNWIDGSKPYQDGVAAMSLPPKGPRGAAQNFERARQVAQRQHEMRVGSSS